MILGITNPSFASANTKLMGNNVQTATGNKIPNEGVITATPKNTVVTSKNVIVSGHPIKTTRVNNAINKSSQQMTPARVKSNDGIFVVGVDDLVYAGVIFGIGAVSIYLSSHSKYIVKVGGHIVRAGSSIYNRVIQYFAEHRKVNKKKKNTHERGQKRKYVPEKKKTKSGYKNRSNNGRHR